MTNLRSICADAGLVDRIRFVGATERDFVPETVYQAYLQAADLGIQLRTFGFGSVSGALIDCIAAGLPTVANDDLADLY